MDTIQLPIPPVGVSVFTEQPSWVNEAQKHEGISFCQAVALATNGVEVWVASDSIKNCNWSPVILGLRAPSTKFEESLRPRLSPGTAGLYVARLDRFHHGIDPAVVIVRAKPGTMREIVDFAGWDNMAWDIVEDQRISRSALRRLFERKETWRSRLQAPVSRGLATMRRAPGWTKLTKTVFKNRTVTKIFDKLIDRTMADMSICRNSVAIPYLLGKANVSYYCTGGIAWGENDPQTMTSGWPWAQWLRLQKVLRWRARK